MRSIHIPWAETRTYAEDLHRRGGRVLVNGSIALGRHVAPGPGWESPGDRAPLADPTAEAFDEILGAASRAGEPIKSDLDGSRRQFIAGTGAMALKIVLNVDV